MTTTLWLRFFVWFSTSFKLVESSKRFNGKNMIATYTFTETPESCTYTIPLKGSSSKNLNVYFSPVHMKINFTPYFLLIDFPARIENEKHSVSSDGNLVVELKKEVKKLWGEGTIPINTKSDKKLMMERRKKGDEEKRRQEDEIYKKSKEKRRVFVFGVVQDMLNWEIYIRLKSIMLLRWTCFPRMKSYART